MFRELEEARLVDEQLHSDHGSVEDLITSRGRLHSLRAELARVRAAIEEDQTNERRSAGLQPSAPEVEVEDSSGAGRDAASAAS